MPDRSGPVVTVCLPPGWQKITGFAQGVSLTEALYDIGFIVKANRFRLTTASLFLCLPFGVPIPDLTRNSGMATACWAKSRRNKPKGLFCHYPQGCKPVVSLGCQSSGSPMCDLPGTEKDVGSCLWQHPVCCRGSTKG